jgi:hypothetical protein
MGCAFRKTAADLYAVVFKGFVALRADVASDRGFGFGVSHNSPVSMKSQPSIIG